MLKDCDCDSKSGNDQERQRKAGRRSQGESQSRAYLPVMLPGMARGPFPHHIRIGKHYNTSPVYRVREIMDNTSQGEEWHWDLKTTDAS